MELHNERVALAEGLRFLGDVPPEHVVLMLDTKGGIASWSKAAEDLFGWKAEEILGRAWETLYAEEERRHGTPRRDLAAAAAHGWVERPAEYRRSDGRAFRGVTTMTSLADAKGRLRGHVLLIESSEGPVPFERYAPRVEQADRVLRDVGVGVTVQDALGHLLYANDTAARLCGYSSPRELIATPVETTRARFAVLDEDGKLLPPEMLPGRRVLAGEEPDPILVQVRERATGRRWWARVFSKGVRNASGKPELAINVWHDVTEEQRKKVSYQHLLELTASLMLTLDYEQRLERLADDLVPRLADWCAIDLIEHGERQPLVLRGPDQSKVSILKALASVRRNGTHALRNVTPTLISRVLDADLAAIAPDERSLEVLRTMGLRSVILVPIYAEHRPTGALVLATSQPDRTYDHRDLELARELAERASVLLDNARSHRAALEAVRMRDDFLSIAAHELRTPLASLSLLLETLLESTSGEDEKTGIRARLALGLRQVHRLTDLVEVLLDVGRLTGDHLVLDFADTDVAALVRETAARCTPEAERARCELRVVAGEDCHAEVDRLRLDQVISNLVGNAVKYGAGKPVDILCGLRAGELHISVHDRGIGIAPADQDRIFRRFERAVGDHHFAGLGLGLWIVREIVAAHGGRIDVHSEVGQGATFEVVLPCSRAKDLKP